MSSPLRCSHNLLLALVVQMQKRGPARAVLSLLAAIIEWKPPSCVGSRSVLGMGFGHGNPVHGHLGRTRTRRSERYKTRPVIGDCTNHRRRKVSVPRHCASALKRCFARLAVISWEKEHIKIVLCAEEDDDTRSKQRGFPESLLAALDKGPPQCP